MISSSEPRRASDENEAPARQSLPSISEVISGARPGQYPPPPAHQQPSSGLPSPFAAPSRQYPDSDKHSPQPLHPASFPSRQDTIPAFADSPRPPFSGRPGLPPVSDRRPTPPGKPDPHSPHIGHHEPPRSVNGYPQPPPPSSHPYQQGQLPPGQMPLPGYPISPREHYDARRPPAHEAEYAARVRYEPAPNRHFETWSYQESFSRVSDFLSISMAMCQFVLTASFQIGSHSRTIFNFAEAYGRIAQEQQGSQPIPERLPTEREVSEMLANAEYIKRSLEQVREVVQASIQSERAREGAKMKGPYEDGHAHAHAHGHGHDVPMYGDGMKPHYPVTEVKKRRGVSFSSSIALRRHPHCTSG